MMSDKMSDVFSLPMLCEDGDGYLYSRDCRHSIVFDDTDTNCMEQKSMVSEAINAYDSNQSLIASQAETIAKLKGIIESAWKNDQKQKEQIELLRDSLNYYMLSVNEVNNAMKDGINVHGALSSFFGHEQMALEALATTGDGE